MTKLLPALILFASLAAHATPGQFCDNDAVQKDAQSLVRAITHDQSAQVDPVDASVANGGSCDWINIVAHYRGQTVNSKALVCETCAVESIGSEIH